MIVFSVTDFQGGLPGSRGPYVLLMKLFVSHAAHYSFLVRGNKSAKTQPNVTSV